MNHSSNKLEIASLRTVAYARTFKNSTNNLGNTVIPRVHGDYLYKFQQNLRFSAILYLNVLWVLTIKVVSSLEWRYTILFNTGHPMRSVQNIEGFIKWLICLLLAYAIVLKFRKSFTSLLVLSLMALGWKSSRLVVKNDLGLVH